jgi:hypothetical protein
MWIVGYGSLMDQQKLKFNDFKLVKVKGWQRIFNRISLSHFWKKNRIKNKIAVLNIIKRPGYYFNAVAYKIEKNELEKLFKREVGYYIAKVETYEFDTNKKFKECKIFISNKKDKQNVIIFKKGILPIPSYINLCRKTAYSYNKKFGKEFDVTTFLVDGKVKIDTFFKKNY